MKPFQLKSETLWVRRTGLPFYDAARVIGVAQLFFGTTEAQVSEIGFGWKLFGITNLNDVDAAMQRLWITFHLRDDERQRVAEWESAVKQNKTKRKSEAINQDQVQMKFERDWEELYKHFLNPFSPNTLAEGETIGLLDAALQSGTRGFDPEIYSHFAAEKGRSPTEPEAEILVASIGISYAATVEIRVKDKPKGAMLLLPIFGSDDENTPASSITTTRYWNYRRRFAHQGGDQLAAVWAMLSMLEVLYDGSLPVKDFAYNFLKDRGPYHSGTLGAHNLCKDWQAGHDSVLRQIGDILHSTHYGDSHQYLLPLVRALAAFVLEATPHNLEQAVKLKVRAMIDAKEGDYRAHRLLASNKELEDIQQMVDIPPVPTGLCRMVAKALTLPKEEGQSETTPKEWIGRYIKLENARDVRSFYAEIERLLTRSLLSKGQSMRASLDDFMETKDHTIIEQMNLLRSQQTFRAWRAAFLLYVLRYTARGHKETPEDTTQPQNSTSGAQETVKGEDK